MTAPERGTASIDPALARRIDPFRPPAGRVGNAQGYAVDASPLVDIRKADSRGRFCSAVEEALDPEGAVIDSLAPL